jgi:hypothetical protein
MVSTDFQTHKKTNGGGNRVVHIHIRQIESETMREFIITTERRTLTPLKITKQALTPSGLH